MGPQSNDKREAKRDKTQRGEGDVKVEAETGAMEMWALPPGVGRSKEKPFHSAPGEGMPHWNLYF